MDEGHTCAHGGCDCRVDEPERAGSTAEGYCSSGCAAGEGCAHSGCHCATRSAAGREERA